MAALTVDDIIAVQCTQKNELGKNDPIFLVVLPAIQTTHLLGNNNLIMRQLYQQKFNMSVLTMQLWSQ